MKSRGSVWVTGLTTTLLQGMSAQITPSRAALAENTFSTCFLSIFVNDFVHVGSELAIYKWYINNIAKVPLVKDGKAFGA